MKRSIVAVAALLLASPLFAEIVVAYVDGIVERGVSGGWTTLFIGDQVEPSDQIRLSPGSYAELSSTGTTVKLSRAGTYRVGDLIQGAGRTQAAGLGSVVLNRINRVAGTQTRDAPTTAGGARASEAVTQTGPVWAGGESVAELIDEGLDLLADGAFLDAYYVFEEAYDFAISDYDYAMAAFYYGYAASLVGRGGQALDLLQSVDPLRGSTVYEQHLLALGQLLVESFSFQDAIDRLRPLAESATAEPEDRQSAELLVGVAYDGLGAEALARSFLLRARERVPGTPAADAASVMLGAGE